MFVEAEPGGDGAGEGGEAAGDEGRMTAAGLHRGDQRGATGHHGDAFGEDLCDDRFRQTLQQRHALGQRRLEIQLSVHRAGGDGGDMRADARLGGQFVDAFLPDHGRIHVGDQQALAAVLGGLDDKVEAERLQICPDVPAVRRDRRAG